MIRFLQKDNRVVKIIFVVIIAVAVVTMVITLVPGIFADENTSSDTYATVHSGGFWAVFRHHHRDHHPRGAAGCGKDAAATEATRTWCCPTSCRGRRRR